jgi:NAD(P)-dependent dehydrogenase (short-subunit alcohol dehydrogenase family)
MPSVFRPDLFDGKRVLVTGGATGIGFGISRSFAAHGADVVLVSRNQDNLAAAATKIGARASYHAADVRDRDAIATIAERVAVVDVLVNCAAGNFPMPFEAMCPNAWQSVLDIVLGGTANCMRSFGEAMLHESRDDGAARAILNIVAGYAWTGAPGVAHSGAAKAGVLNLTKSLAVEWAPHVRVNAVSPGPIAGTEGMKRLGEDLGLDDAVNRTVPLGRQGDVDDIADACLFLASPAADYVTGACLVVDGGQDAVGPFGMLFATLGE